MSDAPVPPAAARPVLRLADEPDAAAILALYRPIVEHTHISFELEPPSVEEMARRVREYGAFGPYIVCEEARAILGFAYASPFRPRRAYRFSVETTVYVAETARRRGIAAALYRALLAGLYAQGFVTAVAGIALPNPESVALHERLGFERAALLRSVGYKHGRWHDVGWWSLVLREPPALPGEPLPVDALGDLPTLLAAEARGIRSRPTAGGSPQA
ncbi:MAG TPA: GNAT family N-acetyltransferase [Thermoanaerobaculia bacterium]|nr:GNAT family N-acetyltransferase [Thermoanaerobaculia bacterium]